MLQVMFNPGLMLTGFRTTGPWIAHCETSLWYVIFLYGNTANVVASKEAGLYHKNCDNYGVAL